MPLVPALQRQRQASQGYTERTLETATLLSPPQVPVVNKTILEQQHRLDGFLETL